jgi:hypothetical protein
MRVNGQTKHALAGVSRRAMLAPAIVAVSLILANCGGGSGGGGGASGPTQNLIGTFKLQGGHCAASHGAPTGSFLVIVDSADSKTVANPAGGCANKYYTPLSPGTDGGLATGQFQEDPTPTFNAHGNSLAGAVIKPVSFLGTEFGMATNPDDVQDAPTGPPAFSPPKATLKGTKLSINLRSLNITYGGAPNSSCENDAGYGCWNLGSKAATGSYDPKTHQFVVQWFVGETFTQLGDSMIVRFEGTFIPEPKAPS